MNRMIKYSALVIAAFAFTQCSRDKENASTGLPGDNLDLYAVLGAFQDSKTPEAFEKALNSPASKVNNLDLDGDGKTDYIRVIDERDGDAHTIVLRVPLGKEKSQDVAVIELEKKGDKTANLQIVGDEALYGKDYIVEPDKKASAAGITFVTTSVAVNVWAWPCVTYMYSPAYVVYVSPWEYEAYPAWWEPWPVVAYEVYYPATISYHVYYGRARGYRFVNVHENYHRNFHQSAGIVYGKPHGHSNYYGPRNGERHGAEKHNAPANFPRNEKHNSYQDGNQQRNSKMQQPGKQQRSPRMEQQNGRQQNPAARSGAPKMQQNHSGAQRANTSANAQRGPGRQPSSKGGNTGNEHHGGNRGPK